MFIYNWIDYPYEYHNYDHHDHHPGTQHNNYKRGSSRMFFLFDSVLTLDYVYSHNHHLLSMTATNTTTAEPNDDKMMRLLYAHPPPLRPPTADTSSPHSLPVSVFNFDQLAPPRPPPTTAAPRVGHRHRHVTSRRSRLYSK